MIKQRKILIENEGDLERAALLGNHHRKEYILDAITKVFVWCVFIIPVLLFLAGVVYYIHLYQVGGWDKIEFYLKEIAKFVVYIAIGVLIHMKILPKEIKFDR